MEKTFFRVGDISTGQGVWYDNKGHFTGLIHDKFSFCMNKDLKMPYDEKIIGYISVVDSLENLYNWFSKEDLELLKNYNYGILEYKATDYKRHDNHYIINAKTSKLISEA